MYIVISQTFDRFAEGVRHRLVGVWVDDEDSDRRHSVGLLLGEEGDFCLGRVVRCGLNERR